MKKRDPIELEKFASHFKQVRQNAGFTQERLAYTSGITLSQIARIETARINPTYLTLKRIAETLEVDLATLVNVKG